jgi:hypothetical protein
MSALQTEIIVLTATVLLAYLSYTFDRLITVQYIEMEITLQLKNQGDGGFYSVYTTLQS